jgi:hypothetical protein
MHDLAGCWEADEGYNRVPVEIRDGSTGTLRLYWRLREEASLARRRL